VWVRVVGKIPKKIIIMILAIKVKALLTSTPERVKEMEKISSARSILSV
jgi:hypothetical protein